jgi:hypothetical protein
MDEAMMNQALAVLQNQFGRHMRGDMLKGEVAMRQALMQQLQMDESSADKAVKQLAHTGWISFRSGAAPAADDGTVHTGATTTTGQGVENAPGVTDAENETRLTTGDPQADPTVRAEPIIAAGALTGMQSGSAMAGATGGAYVGAAAAGLAGAQVLGDHIAPETADPDRDENLISSYAADQHPAAEPGYWLIKAPGERPAPPQM